MTLQECYIAMNGDYEEVMARLRKESFVQKLILKFLDDGSYELLQKSIESQNYEDAFRAAHTIKGVCQNLSFTELMKSSSALTESLRSGYSPEAGTLLEQVAADYEKTISAIRMFQEGIAG